MTVQAGTAYTLCDTRAAEFAGVVVAGIDTDGGFVQVAFDSKPGVFAIALGVDNGSRNQLSMKRDVALQFATLVQILVLQIRIQSGRSRGATFTRFGATVFDTKGGRPWDTSPILCGWDATSSQAVARPVSDEDGGGFELIMREDGAVDLALAILEWVAANGMMGPLTGTGHAAGGPPVE